MMMMKLIIFFGLTSVVDDDAATRTKQYEVPIAGELIDVRLLEHAATALTYMPEDDDAYNVANHFTEITISGDLSSDSEISDKYGLAIDYKLNKAAGAYLQIEFESDTFTLSKSGILPNTHADGSVPGGNLDMDGDTKIISEDLALANASNTTSTIHIGNRTPATADTLVQDGSATEYLAFAGSSENDYADYDDEEADQSVKFTVTMISN